MRAEGGNGCEVEVQHPGLRFQLVQKPRPLLAVDVTRRRVLSQWVDGAEVAAAEVAAAEVAAAVSQY